MFDFRKSAFVKSACVISAPNKLASTSDALLKELTSERDLYRVSYHIKKPLPKRLMANIDSLLEKADDSGWRRRFESRLPR